MPIFSKIVRAFFLVGYLAGAVVGGFRAGRIGQPVAFLKRAL